MPNQSDAGWVYILTHPAWRGMVKIGMTKHDPRKRAAKITSVSGLVLPCCVACCIWVSDRAAVENAVHRRLGYCRVTKRRELFRTDVDAARAAIESASCAKQPMFVVARRRHSGRRYWPRIGRRHAAWRSYVVAALMMAVFVILLSQIR